MVDFRWKQDFSPWKVENTEKSEKSEKMNLTWLGPVRGEGVTKMGKNFFAFLDVLDHLEAIKKY